MIDSYFNCLIALQDIRNEISNFINDYTRKNNLNITVVEAILLNIIISQGSKCNPKDLSIITDKLYSNNFYNLKKLINNGYISSEKNVTGYSNIDGRCTILTVTEKGENFYDDLCDYLINIFKKKNINIDFNPMLKEIACLRKNIS